MAARPALQAREAACNDPREREALTQSAKQLRNWEAKICERYPHALLDAFSKPHAAKKAGSLASSDVGFDELELMDEVQVLTGVTLARTPRVVDEGNPWVASQEAHASNFMELLEVQTTSGDTFAVSTPMVAGDVAGTNIALTLGCWVELLVGSQWVRTQLTWASFRDRLLALGHLRVISGGLVVDGALNAVAQMAMRNSVNSMF